MESAYYGHRFFVHLLMRYTTKTHAFARILSDVRVHRSMYVGCYYECVDRIRDARCPRPEWGACGGCYGATLGATMRVQGGGAMLCGRSVAVPMGFRATRNGFFPILYSLF